MLKIAICDDESTFLDNIEMFVKKYEKERGTQIFLKKYLSGLDLEDSLNLKFDIVFLDINMPGINGMELAKGIRKKDEHTIIMFLTSLKEYVFEGYQVEASGYLTKPISYKRFSSELDRVAKKVLRDSALFISIKNNNDYFNINCCSIYYFDVVNRIINIHTADTTYLCSNKTLQNFEKELDPYLFFRCYNSVIINLMYVESIKGYEISLINGEKMPLSRSKKKDLLKKMSYYLGKYEL